MNTPSEQPIRPKEVYHRIRRLQYNWFSTTEQGDEYETVVLGEDGVKVIGEHLPKGAGDVLYYEVIYDDGSFKRIFNPNLVDFETVSPITMVDKPPLIGMH